MVFTQTVKGTAADDELNGADEGDDFIFGYGGNDRIIGYARHDHLFGGSGDDILFGDLGNDVLSGGPGADLLDGGAGFDLADYSSSGGRVIVTLSAGAGTGLRGAAHGDTLTGIEGIYGSAFGDALTGGRGAQTLLGLDGDDGLSGGDHADTLDGGAGDDRLYGDAGDDLLQGGAGADAIDGGDGFDMAAYYGGAALVDMLRPWRNTGDAAGDALTGVEGLYGGAFDDTLIGDDGDNRLNGNEGDDVLRGRGGDDILRGGGQHDRLAGGEGNDIIEGGGAMLNGGAGDDVLNQSLGAFDEMHGQRMIGGDGADVFHTDPTDHTVVRILDFEPGVDKIDLHLSYAYLPGGVLDPASFVLGTSALDGNDHVIYDPATGRLWFDTDGAGGSEAILFAVLTSRPELSATDFII